MYIINEILHCFYIFYHQSNFNLSVIILGFYNLKISFYSKSYLIFNNIQKVLIVVLIESNKISIVVHSDGI